MNVAANLLLSGIDPVGVPWMQANVLEREIWTATIKRAATLSKGP